MGKKRTINRLYFVKCFVFIWKFESLVKFTRLCYQKQSNSWPSRYKILNICAAVHMNSVFLLALKISKGQKDAAQLVSWETEGWLGLKFVNFGVSDVLLFLCVPQQHKITMTKFKKISRIQREKENKTMRDLAGGGLFNLKSIIVIHPKKKKKKKKRNKKL